MTSPEVHGFAGVSRRVQVTLRLAPTRSAVNATAKALGGLIDEAPSVPVSLAGVGCDGSRVLLTIAVDLGTVEDVTSAAPSARAAVSLLHRIVHALPATDPALVLPPAPESMEATLADRLVAGGPRSWAEILPRLAVLT